MTNIQETTPAKDNETASLQKDIESTPPQPEYNPYTDLFSDNPYDLSTGRPISENASKPSQPVIDRRLERRKIIGGILTALLLAVPVSIALCCIMFIIRSKGLGTDQDVLGLTILFGLLFTVVVTPLMIRRNGSAGGRSIYAHHIKVFGKYQPIDCLDKKTSRKSKKGGSDHP